MVKSKFPGKPSKIVQRSLVRAFSVNIPSCDSSTVSEEVVLGLSVFDQTFGVKDEVSSFRGFSSAEIDRSIAKKEEFVSRVREKFAQRGISLASPPSSAARHSSAAGAGPPIVVPRSSASAATETAGPAAAVAAATDVELPPVACKRERRKRGAAKLWVLNKKAAAGRHQQRHGKLPAAAAATGFKALSKNSLIRFKHKSAATNYLSDRYCRKFVLPSRSAHSSRVIKPNKRFADGDKCGKAGRLLLRNFKTHKYEADAKSRAADERARRGGAAATAGAGGGAGNQLSPPGKVIIREARLNITSESAIAGPFSAAKKAIVFEKDKFKSGVITCGICGAIRHYKYILQTKKFGIYSCEPCRRFILKMIKQSKQSDCEILECKAENGIGKCLIDSGVMCPQKMIEESPTKSSRCQACWLKLCLQKYMVPSTLRKMLIKLMPEELKVLSSCLISADLMRKSLYYETDNPVYRIKNEPEDGNDTLKKRLRIQHFSKSCSANRRLMEKSDAGSTKTRPFHVKNVPNHKLNSRHKWAAENSCKELEGKELQLPRGPRIKHVCRSASSVLRTSLANSNDADEEDEECLHISSESEVNGAERSKNEDEKSEKLNGGDNCCHYDDSLENYSKQFEARTLQDFCKEAMVSTEDSEDKLISIDFWEAYDPDEIYKTGFSLIGTESTNVRALCFLCGSAGLEKLLYCVSCCEAYHWYCAEGPSVFREETELEKCRVNWVCRKCKVCSTCGERSARALISCQRCRCSYHPECLTNKALNKRLFNSDRPWVCPSCLKCKSCNNSSVFTFVGNVPLCSQCFKLRQKGNYCPLCQGCYEDEDYNVQMMECGICKCWIHAKCEGLSDEKYQILSFLPESIEFVCKLCCQTPPPQWWLAVEDELKTGYLGILKKLCKNKQINELFKESPRKNHVCQCQQSQPPESSSQAAPLDNSPPSTVMNPADETVRPTKRWLNFDDETETAQLRNVDEASSPDVAVAADDSRGASSDDGDSLEGSTAPAVEPPLESGAVAKPCEACSAAHEEPSKTNQGLLAVKSNVHNSRYASLSAFHSDLEQVIAQIDDGCFLATYHDTVKIFFPWFDVEKAHRQNQPTDAPVDAQLNDAGASGAAVATGAELCDELANATDDEHYEQLRCLMAADDYPYEQLRMLDVRACILCKSMGEAAPTEGGRLIYCGRNEWVHSNCALWSSEVFEEIDGSLQNVHSAVSRGRQIRCSLCEKKGASIGCCFKNCGLTYHFGCARKVRCKFFHNKTIYCRAHETPSEDPAAYSLLTSEKDFEILRPVYVEMERKKKRLECHANVKLRIGSLLVESLGRIDPHLSDHPERIIPMHFRCTRLFWSTVKPWKIVRYCVQIRLRFTCAAAADESELNYTVEHSTPEEIVQRVLDELVRKVCVADEYRLCEANSGQTDLLFPELQDTIYKDLPTDVLNDHTLHDIWNNYDSADRQPEASPPKDEGARSDAPRQVRPAVKASPKARLKRDLKPAKSRTGKCANGKYLRDKNNVIRESAKQSYTPNYWYKQLRGCGAKRKMNFENASSQAARKRKYENCKLSEGAARYFSAYENILQLDGMAEIYAGDEEPVKCVQCHRTYRTTLSFERHLETCNSDFGDFMISSCESDSASGEEDKYCAAAGAELLNVANGGLVVSASPTAVSEFNVVPQMCDDSFAGSKYAGGPTTYIVDGADKVVPVQSFNGGAANMCANVTYNGVYPYAAATYEDARLMDNCGAVIQSNAIPLDSLLQGAVKQEPLPTIVSSPISLHTVEQPAVKLNFVSNGLVASKSCADYVTAPQFTFAGASLPSQQYEIQNLAAPAYVIHQSYPVTDIIPTYVAVDNSGTHDTTTYLSQPATTLQQQLPTTSVNFQPIVPTILGTFVQPSIVETPTYIVNAAAASPATGGQTYGAAAPQSNIILPSQPMLFGLETVVSNTIMSSSQFLTQSHIGNMGGSTMYSTTTTQVFQAAKPMPQQPDLGSGYIVLNPSTSVSSTPTILQTNVGQPTTVATSAGLSPAKQLEPVITSRPTDVEAYMYVHLDQGSVPAASLLTAAKPSSVGIERKKAPPMIMKPVKQPPIQPKKSIKIMKVKNNRPVSIEVKHISPVSIEVKHVPGTSPAKPSFVLSNSSNEQPRKLQIKTTDTAVMLGQHVPVYQFAEPTIPTKNVTTTPSPYRNGFCIETPTIDQDRKAVPGLAERDVVTFKSEPAAADINSSAAPTPVTMPRVCSQTSDPIHPIKRERTSPVEEVNCNSAVTSTLVQTAPTKSEPQPLFIPPIDNSLKIEKSDSHPKQLPSLQLSPSPVSQASKPVPSDTPSNEPAAKVPRTESKAQNETERLFDELMRQHLENEQRRKQRLAEATAVPKPASPPPALSPKVQMSASMPLLDEKPPTEPEKVPYRLTLLKTKYKPRLQPRISEEGAVVGDVPDKKVATGAALAAAPAKKLNKSPEKENQEIRLGKANSTTGHKAWKTASISFEVSAEDGFSCKSDNLLELWNKILESVQQSRAKYKLPLLPKNASKDEESVYSLLGFENNASKYLIEQLPDAWKCIFYKPVFHKPPTKSSKTPLVENKTGCARSEPFAFNHKYDMFGWLSSESREPPKYIMSLDSEMLNANRRTSPNLPMAMRFRHLKDTAKETVFVFRSNIHGRGLFCLRDIDAEEMVIEYAGEVIRSTLTDKREKYYTSKGIGCYMFRIDDRYVVDATMRGNAARFINHSCEPNCYSRIVDILGKKHILIFALQKIKKGDELTYDYKFPLEDEKIACHCRKPKCRQYLN